MNMSVLKRYLGAVVLIGLTFLPYLSVIHAGFVWDDDVLITDNALVKDPGGLWRAWWTTETPEFYPITQSLFWIEWRMWGANATGYHVVNILLHALGAVLVWQLLGVLKIPGAFVAALIFAVHPVNVASVAWVSEGKNTVSLIFYLLALIGFVKFRNSSMSKWYIISLIMFACALLSKTSVVMLPIILIGIIWWQRGLPNRKDIVQTIPFFALSCLFAWIALHFQDKSDHPGQYLSLAFSPTQRLVLAGQIWWFYLSKLLFPVNLVAIYPRWDLSSMAPWQYLCPLSALAVLTILWLARHRIGKGPAAAMLYFTLSLFPILGFFNFKYMNHSFVADHLQYVACLGPLALVGAGIAWCCGRLGRSGTWVHAAAGAVILVPLGILTFHQGQVYKDIEVFSWAILEKNPDNWGTYDNLDLFYDSHNKQDEGLRRFIDHLERNPRSVEANNHMGNWWRRAGNADKALSYYQKALAIQPDNWDIQNNIGTLLADQGKLEEALAYLQSVVKAQPRLGGSCFNLGSVLFRLGKVDEAVSYLQKAAEYEPSDNEIRQALDQAMSLQRQLALDLEIYQAKLKAAPQDPAVHLKLGQILERQGKPKEAMSHYHKAIEQARAAGKQDLVREIEQRLSKYKKE